MTKATTSTDLVPEGAVVNGQDLVVSGSGASLADIRYAVTNKLRLYVEENIDEDAFLLQQINKSNSTESEILDTQSLTSLEALYNVPVRVTGYHGLRNSKFDSKLGVYAIFDVTDRDGVVTTTSSSSADVIVKLVQLRDGGHIPQSGWTVFAPAEEATAAGFHPINMRSIADPF